jgi:hypothetical protein
VSSSTYLGARLIEDMRDEDRLVHLAGAAIEVSDEDDHDCW